MERGKSIIIIVALTLTLCTMVVPQPAAATYLGRTTTQQRIPFLTLYDPYGDNSYQKLTMNDIGSIQFDLKADAGGFLVSGKLSYTVESTLTYSSSIDTQNPANIGPGKGDAIVGYIVDTTWDVYQYYGPMPQSVNPESGGIGKGTASSRSIQPSTVQTWYRLSLVSYEVKGAFVNSRSDLASKGTTVPDKTGQPGAKSYLWSISAGYPVDKTIKYTWSSTLSVGYSMSVDVFGIHLSGISWTMTIDGTHSITTECRYFDSSHAINFWEYADAWQDWSNINSYVYWFGPS